MPTIEIASDWAASLAAADKNLVAATILPLQRLPRFRGGVQRTAEVVALTMVQEMFNRVGFVDALLCDKPHPELTAEQDVFAPLIGSWDLEVTWFENDSPIRRANGEWHFSRVLEGRAVQDVWIVPSRADRDLGGEPYEYGASLRFFDRQKKAWRSTWTGPMRGLLLTFVVSKEVDDIVLESYQEGGRLLQWRFGDIMANRFTWCSRETMSPHGWRTLQTFVATRAAVV